MVGQYFRHAGLYHEPQAVLCTPANTHGDPLYAVWAMVRAPEGDGAEPEPDPVAAE